MSPGVAVALPLPTTITVNSLLDNGPGNCNSTCTLRDAVASSAAGDTIDFSVTGTITLNGSQIYIAHDLTIDGPGARNLTVSGNDQSRVFDIGSGTVTITGLTITHGKPNSNDEFSLQGGAILDRATLNLSRATMSNSVTSTSGGGIYNQGGVLNVADSTFVDNGSTFGAAIGSEGTTNIAASTFTGNSTGYSTVVVVSGATNITNSTFFGNGNQPVASQATADISNSILNDSFCSGSMTGSNNLAPGSCPGSIGTVTGLDTTLANNGGPTDTFNLSGTSNAVDAAYSCNYPAAFTASIFDATKDQRGLTRPIGTGCDIGAVEAITLSPTSLSDGTYNTSYSQAFSVSAGGIGPYSFSESGTPPTNLGFSGNSLSGTPSQTGSFDLTVKATDANGFVGEQAYSLTINAASTMTTASNATTTFGASNQNVTLSATVTSTVGTVNEGSVTFTILDGGTTIGTATSGSVTNGSASVSYTLPGGTAAKGYTIQADYHDATGNFADSSDGTHTLTINAANTMTAAANATASDVDSSVTLSATVTSPSGTVNQGSVTFTVTDSNNNQVGSPVSGAVSNGAASASFTPTGMAPDTYTITAAYHDSAGSLDDSNGTATLTINPGPPASLALAPGDTSGVVGSSVTETATVKDQYGYVVADGTTVDYSVTGVTSTSGSATTTNGQASFSYSAALPGTDSLEATAEDGNHPSASAQIDWTLPASTSGASVRVSNLSSPYVVSMASTGFSGHPFGLLIWNHASVSLMTTNLTALVASGHNASLYGTATLANRETVAFRLDVVGGFRGTVRLRLSNGYDSGALRVMSSRVSGG